MAVVEAARRRLKRHSDSRSISRRLVLLDSDRVETDKAAGRDASLSASRWGLEVVFAVPNLEGLLIRLYNGHETRFVSAPDALRQLRKLWPEYGKGALSILPCGGVFVHRGDPAAWNRSADAVTRGRAEGLPGAKAFMPSALSTLVYILSTAVDMSVTRAQVADR